MDHETHKRNYRLAREAYESDKVNHPHHSFSVDMEKVLLLPHMPQYKEAIFTRRLVTFNETFARLGADEAPLAVLWNEAIAGRKDENVTSSWIKAIEHLAGGYIQNSREIILWADNCGAQNKCWTLFTALCWLVNSSSPLDTITVKYLESGHTFMSADSFHHKVELSIKQSKMLYHFQDFVSAVERAGTPLVMAPHDFKSWPKSFGTSSQCKAERPLLEEVRVVCFQRGCTEMLFKNEHDDLVYQRATFLRRKEDRSIKQGCSIAWSQEGSRGLMTAKKADIVNKLCPLMTPDKRSYWIDLPVKDGIPDLNVDFD